MENTIMDNYEIKLDRRVLKQLGSQLYGDTPSVIAELVANSYDADANNVWITIDTVNNNVIVEDDGKGMTAGDINESFLNIGYDKRSDNGVTDSGRKIMGRKGIGKLATFSLTNTVRVLSSKDHKKAGCILDFKRITEDDAEPDAINPDVIIFDEKRLSKNGTGTRLELIGVKKKITVSFRFIVSKLMRTFDVNDLNFSIHIRKNNEKYRTLIRSELDYFSIMDTIITIGENFASKLESVNNNSIPERYKLTSTYDEYIAEDLMVIFLFSKAFYDSNICISEAGAAWATNQNCMNVVIDISFSDIEKPSNNALSSIKFQQIRTPDQTITVTEFFKTIIEEGLHFEYDESKLQKALNYVLKTDKYSDQKIDFPATFLPKRKFLPVPRCPKCHNIMLLTEENGRLKYVCSNVSCDECYEAVIN